MVNPNKVRMMTKIASFEKKNKKSLDNLSYFKTDYVGFNTFLVLLGVSVSLALFFLADVGIKFINDTQEFMSLDFLAMAKHYGLIWLVFMIVYGVLASLIYRKKYNTSAVLGEQLERMLKKLRKYN